MDRREVLKMGAAALAATLPSTVLAGEPGDRDAKSKDVEQWGLFEIVLRGPATGNPFREVTLGARFTQEHRTVDVKGFYDGAGTYRIRFMPDAIGPWS